MRIEAEGFKVATSRDIKSNESNIEVHFELLKATDIAARVQSAEGATVDRDGSFQIDDVPPGKYLPNIRFSTRPSPG